MNFNPQSPAKSLLPAFHIRNVERSRLDGFKSEPVRLPGRLGHSAGEPEEYLKNIVADFLKEGSYRDEHYINTRDRQDLVIHTGKTTKDSVGVILEVKRPDNRAEIVSVEKPNAKALQEILQYYLNEQQRADKRKINVKAASVRAIPSGFTKKSPHHFLKRNCSNSPTPISTTIPTAPKQKTKTPTTNCCSTFTKYFPPNTCPRLLPSRPTNLIRKQTLCDIGGSDASAGTWVVWVDGIGGRGRVA